MQAQTLTAGLRAEVEELWDDTQQALADALAGMWDDVPNVAHRLEAAIIAAGDAAATGALPRMRATASATRLPFRMLRAAVERYDLDPRDVAEIGVFIAQACRCVRALQ